MSSRKRKNGPTQNVSKMLRAAKKSPEPLESAEPGDQVISEAAATSCEISYRSYCEKAKRHRRGLSIHEGRTGRLHRSRSATPEPELGTDAPVRSRTRLDADALAYIERLTVLTSTKALRREDHLNLVSIVRAHGLHGSPRVSLAALSLLEHMSKMEQPVKMAQGTDGPTLVINTSCWLPVSWEKREHQGEKQRESQLQSKAYDVERKGPTLPPDHILSCLVAALHSVSTRPADPNGAVGEVLLLRHVVKLLALDLRLRIRVFTLRGPLCESRVKLLYSSILWSLYAEAPADIRKDIIKMLAETTGHVTDSCEVRGISGTSPIPNLAYACGPAECAGLAQQLLMLILELLGTAEDAQLFNTHYVSRGMGNLRAEVDDLLNRLLTGHLKDELGHESKLRSLDQKAALLSALQPADRLRTLGLVVAKKRVNTRNWECCKRMDDVLQQLEHEPRKVQGFVCFNSLDVLDYLLREAAQPNDHDQRILIGNSGLSSPDGLALLLCSIAGAEMERTDAFTGGPQDGEAANLRSTASGVIEALLCGHNSTQKGRSTLLQASIVSVTAALAVLDSH